LKFIQDGGASERIISLVSMRRNHHFMDAPDVWVFSEDAITNKFGFILKRNVLLLHKAFFSFFAPLGPLGLILVQHFLKECSGAAM